MCMVLVLRLSSCFAVTCLIASKWHNQINNRFSSSRDPIQGVLQGSLLKPLPTKIYLFKVSNGNTKKKKGNVLKCNNKN